MQEKGAWRAFFLPSAEILHSARNLHVNPRRTKRAIRPLGARSEAGLSFRSGRSPSAAAVQGGDSPMTELGSWVARSFAMDAVRRPPRPKAAIRPFAFDRLGRWLGRGFVVDVGALAVAVEDHDELRWAVNGREGVRCHGGELGGLAGLDGDLAFAERQAHLS